MISRSRLARGPLREPALPAARLDRRPRRRRAQARRRDDRRGSRCATCSGSRRACSRACCRGCTRRCSSAPTPTRTPGVPVYILTAASQEMADLLAHVLAFDGGLGSRSEIVDGRYTGRPAGPFNYREGKVVSMRELAEREGIDLGASYAYSDSESDLPMLRAVGHAGRRQPRCRAAADRRRGGLGGRRARPPRPAAEGARRARRRHRAGVRRRALLERDGGARRPAGARSPARSREHAGVRARVGATWSPARVAVREPSAPSPVTVRGTSA